MEMDIIYFGAGCFVIFIALVKRELLFNPQTFELILIVAAVLFLDGLVLIFTGWDRSLMAGALLSPLVTAGLFWAMLKLFRRLFKRNPRDTFNDWTPGMAADRMFNIIYFTLAMLSSVLVVALVGELGGQ